MPGDEVSKIPGAEIIGFKEWKNMVQDKFDGDLKGVKWFIM